MMSKAHEMPLFMDAHLGYSKSTVPKLWSWLAVIR